MMYLVSFVRILFALLFVLSGAMKANDPLGLGYKMDEFWDVFGLQFLKPYSLWISLVLIHVEILIGVFLLLRIELKRTVWVSLVLMVFFTLLTAYAYFSGQIKTCGCFGDCLVLQAGTSFVKDVVLLLCAIFLIYAYQAKKLLPAPFTLYKKRILAAYLLLAFLLQIIVLENLPFKDCLPYRKGMHLREALQAQSSFAPQASEVEVYYQYRKDKQLITFPSSSFPADFDSTYEYVNRIDKPRTREGIHIEVDKLEFDVFDQFSQSQTKAILAKETPVFLLFLKDVADFRSVSVQQIIKKIQQKSFFENASFYLISSVQIDSESKLLSGIPVQNFLLCDNVMLKTLCRSSVVLYHIQAGVIRDKKGFMELTYFFS